jgi:hypothetical protein
MDSLDDYAGQELRVTLQGPDGRAQPVSAAMLSH